MKCMFCGHEDSKVLDSRITDDGNSIRRRRECQKCGKRFTTYETVEIIPVLVVKTDGTRQPFNIEKVKGGMIKACYKRPVSMQKIEEMASNVEKKVYGSLNQEISSKEIGELVMEELKATDDVAYVRFASIYRQFKDVGTFIEFLKKI